MPRWARSSARCGPTPLIIWTGVSRRSVALARALARALAAVMSCGAYHLYHCERRRGEGTRTGTGTGGVDDCASQAAIDAILGALPMRIISVRVCGELFCSAVSTWQL